MSKLVRKDSRSMKIAWFRKKPVEVSAIQFLGDNFAEVEVLTGRMQFRPVSEEDREDDRGVIAEVFDVLHSTWVGVKKDQWIIRGVKGEFYPCDPSVFAATYEPAQRVAGTPTAR